MRRKLFMIYDSAADMYMGPLVYKEDGEALRDFKHQAIAAENKISANPEHFSIFRVGEICDNKGEVFPQDRVCLATALEMVAESQKVKPGIFKALDLEELKAGGSS